jgi:hypothetical protein
VRCEAEHRERRKIHLILAEKLFRLHFCAFIGAHAKGMRFRVRRAFGEDVEDERETQAVMQFTLKYWVGGL